MVVGDGPINQSPTLTSCLLRLYNDIRWTITHVADTQNIQQLFALCSLRSGAIMVLITLAVLNILFHLGNFWSNLLHYFMSTYNLI